MPIENAILELAAAVRLLAESNSKPAAVTAAPTTVAKTQDVAKPEAPKADKPKAETPPPKQEPEAAPAGALTYDDVKAAVRTTIVKNRDHVVATLAKFGVKTATELPESEWAKFIDALQAA